MSWNTITVRVVEAGQVMRAAGRRAYHLCRDRPITSGVALGLLLTGSILVSLVDWSPTLDTRQEQAVRDFVLRTNSPVVLHEFERARVDGLSANEVQHITEVAKAQDPGYGLISEGPLR